MADLTYTGGKQALDIKESVTAAVNSIIPSGKLPVTMAGGRFYCRAHWTDRALLASFLRHHEIRRGTHMGLDSALCSTMSSEANDESLDAKGNYNGRYGANKITPEVRIARPKGLIPRWKQIALFGGLHRKLLW